MKKVTINVNNEGFTTNCLKEKTDQCGVCIYSRNLSRYASVVFSTKRTETEKTVNLKCSEEKGAKAVFMAVRAICDTCIYSAQNRDNQKK